MKTGIFMVGGVIGAILSAAFGEWDFALKALCIAMAADYITGLVVAGVFHASPKTESGTLESKAGWKGLARKFVTLLIVVLAHWVDLTLGVTYLRDVVIYGFMANELISLIENAGLMGIPMPKALLRAIDVLKDKAGDDDE